MRYEIYGVYSSMGTNDFLGVARSYKSAVRLALEALPSPYIPVYAILKRKCSASAPLAIYTGRAGQLPHRVCALGRSSHGIANPLENPAEGPGFWSTDHAFERAD